MSSLPSFASVPDYAATDTQVYLDAAADIIRGYCRWHIWPVRTETITLDGPGRRALFLPTMKLLAVTDVTEEDVAVPITRRWWSEAGWIRKPPGQCWTDELGGITMTITHGYESLPPALRGLTLDLARKAAANPTGVIQRSVGSRSETYAQSQLVADDFPQLEPFRRMV